MAVISKVYMEKETDLGGVNEVLACCEYEVKNYVLTWRPFWIYIKIVFWLFLRLKSLNFVR